MNSEQTSGSDEQTSQSEVDNEASLDVAEEIETAEEVTIESLTRRLEEAEAQAKAHWDSVLRTQAELENLRKRSQRDVENAHKFGLERFIAELLPIRDSMELGLSAASEEGVDPESVREGVELTLKMLNGALEKHGIEEINPVDAVFDPEAHQAMSVQEVDGIESGTVTMVMQKGFRLNGRLLRPALVMVAK